MITIDFDFLTLNKAKKCAYNGLVGIEIGVFVSFIAHFSYNFYYVKIFLCKSDSRTDCAAIYLVFQKNNNFRSIFFCY